MKNGRAFAKWLEQERFINTKIDGEKFLRQEPPPTPPPIKERKEGGRRIYIR